MGKEILIAGGAGFIGSHLADELLQAGYEVRALGNLLAQVHGPTDRPPAYVSSEVEFLQGDVRHCRADISRAQQVLGCEPQTYLEGGLAELAQWLGGQNAIDRVDQATGELERRGLTL